MADFFIRRIDTYFQLKLTRVMQYDWLQGVKNYIWGVNLKSFHVYFIFILAWPLNYNFLGQANGKVKGCVEYYFSNFWIIWSKTIFLSHFYKKWVLHPNDKATLKFRNSKGISLPLLKAFIWIPSSKYKWGLMLW